MIQRIESFAVVAFLQYVDFVSTWLFSLTGVEEGNPLVMAYRHGGSMLERVVLIKLFCLVLLANMFLRERSKMSYGNRAVGWLVATVTRGRVQLEQRHFYNAFVTLMLIAAGWNLLIAIGRSVL